MKNTYRKSKILLISPFPDSGLTDMKEPPHVVGISAMTPDIIWAAKIAKGIKAALPHVPIVIGGPHINAMPRESLEEFPYFDLAIVGEGEFAMLELADSQENGNLDSSLNDIKGIAFRNGKDIIVNPPREYIRDLDALPFPAWDLFPLPRTNNYPIYATRGCPFNCKFCQRVLGNKIRRRSVKNVVEEIEWVLDTFKTNGFWFGDETFGVNKQWTSQLLDSMIEKGFSSKAVWHAQTRVDLLSEDLLNKMKQAGCDAVAFGIESGNQGILSKTSKNIKLEDAKTAVALCKRLGIKTRSFFILGHPYETVETIKDTIDFAVKLNTTFVSFAVMVPYPGTEVWRLAKRGEAGYSFVSDNWDDYRKHLAAPLGFDAIPAETLRFLDKKAYLNFYLRNHRWLDFIQFLWGHKSSIKAYIIRRLLKNSKYLPYHQSSSIR
jgi:radical SAM superfamily enzyme YgiQ (UPF0313 family)